MKTLTPKLAENDEPPNISALMAMLTTNFSLGAKLFYFTTLTSI